MPPGPLPASAWSSMPSSAAARFASGDAATPADDCARGSVGVATAVRTCSTAVALLPEESISASGAQTLTVAPSSATILTITPAAGAGTSTSTLSVVTSTRGSPLFTLSPTCLRQLVTVPSATDSPSSGRVTITRLSGTAYGFAPAQADPGAACDQRRT